jgi:hypothetical protein
MWKECMKRVQQQKKLVGNRYHPDLKEDLRKKLGRRCSTRPSNHEDQELEDVRTKEGNC